MASVGLQGITHWYPENALGREREQGERQECGSTWYQPCPWQHQGSNHQALPAYIRPWSVRDGWNGEQCLSGYRQWVWDTAQSVRTWERSIQEACRKRQGNGNHRSRVVARNHVAAFIKSFYRRTDMFMLEIKPDFIKGFAAYLSTKAGLHNGTIWEKCMWLKGVVMCVHFNGLIPKKTFAQFHISPNVTEREFLTEDELKTLMTHELGMSNCSIFVTFLFSPASLPSLSWTSRN